MRSQAQYMALLAKSLSAAEAAKLPRAEVSRVRQRLRQRSLFIRAAIKAAAARYRKIIGLLRAHPGPT